MSLARWLQDRPAILEAAYRLTVGVMQRSAPLLRRIGFTRLGRLFEAGERLTKGPLFDCRMCGMCVLHSTGMTCPMTCPKTLRNGPCGGVRPDGRCEVKPEMDCVWALAWERSAKSGRYSGEIGLILPPVDRRLEGTSAWLNMLDERDVRLPPGWSEAGCAQREA